MIPTKEMMFVQFHLCNRKYFEGRLPFPRFELLHSFRTCGCFRCDVEGGLFNKRLFNFSISMTDCYDFTDAQFKDIFVHEMVHYYLAYYGIDKNAKHGRAFKKLAKSLNERYGLHITETLDLTQYKRREGTSKFGYWLAQLI